MKKVLYCFVLSIMLVSCGSGNSKNRKYSDLLPDGHYMRIYYEYNYSPADPLFIVAPLIYKTDNTLNENYDTSNAVWTVEPENAGTFEVYVSTTPTFPPGSHPITDIPMYKGANKFLWNGNTKPVTIILELNGAKYKGETQDPEQWLPY